MGWYKCVECGHIFEDGEIDRWDEYRGECHGVPAYESMAGCPSCSGDFEEASECDSCGGVFLKEELFWGMCEQCLYDYGRYDFKTCFEFADNDNEKTSIEINSFLTSVLDENEIEQILLDFIATHRPKVDCKDFIDEDRDWFAKKIIEKEGK